MRFSTTGRLRPIDIVPLVDLVPPLLHEWRSLEFTASGEVINPITAGTERAVALVGGGHRQPGSRYVVTIGPPAPGPDGQVVEPAVLDVLLLSDDARQLVAVVTDATGNWSVEVAVTHRSDALPHVTIDGRADLTAIIRAGSVTGCLAPLFGGTAEGRAEVDLAQLQRSDGRAVDASGRANRFRGTVRLDLGRPPWEADLSLQVGARGLGRLVMLVVGRRIRRSLVRSFDDAWASADRTMEELADEMDAVREMTVAEGGPESLVHRLLWDPGFDLPESLRPAPDPG